MSAVFSTDVPVRWSDQDVNRHVNNARVVTLIEEARLAALFHWLGTDGIPDPAQPRVVVSLHLEYLRPVDHGPALTALHRVTRVGRSSYTLSCELRQHGQAAARAETVLVQMDPATGRSVPLPERVRAALEALLAGDDARDKAPEDAGDDARDGTAAGDEGADVGPAAAGASRA